MSIIRKNSITKFLGVGGAVDWVTQYLAPGFFGKRLRYIRIILFEYGLFSVIKDNLSAFLNIFDLKQIIWPFNLIKKHRKNYAWLAFLIFKSQCWEGLSKCVTIRYMKRFFSNKTTWWKGSLQVVTYLILCIYDRLIFFFNSLFLFLK